MLRGRPAANMDLATAGCGRTRGGGRSLQQLDHMSRSTDRRRGQGHEPGCKSMVSAWNHRRRRRRVRTDAGGERVVGHMSLVLIYDYTYILIEVLIEISPFYMKFYKKH